MLRHDIDTKIQSLMKRLDGNAESVVLVHENQNISPILSKHIFDGLLDYLEDGTLSIMGDASLSENVNANDDHTELTNQERIVLSSGRMLQLLVLNDDTTFATHPSLMVGNNGKFARFFARQVALDFPYGEKSVFEDFYELNAMILFIGEPLCIDEVRYVATKMQQPVIRKNTCIKDDQVVAYLDYDVQVEDVLTLLMQSNLLLFEQIENTRIYGITYQMLIDFALKYI